MGVYDRKVNWNNQIWFFFIKNITQKDDLVWSECLTDEGDKAVETLSYPSWQQRSDGFSGDSWNM